MNDNNISHQRFTVVVPFSKSAHSTHWLFLIWFFYNLNEYFKWSEEAQEAFDYLTNALLQPPILKCPNFELPFILGTDASNLGLGVVL